MISGAIYRRRTPYARFASTRNPFSPEYDKTGLGRIEISPSRYRQIPGSIGYNFANDFWNSRNPYAAQKAPFHLNELSGTLSGPVNKRASFNLNLIREWVDNATSSAL